MRTKVFALLVALMASVSVMAQQQEERQLTKQEIKALQDRIDSALNVEAENAIRDSMFTLEAHQVVFKYGQTAYVTSHTNFIAVKKSDAVVQVAFNVPFAGQNGLGGVTVSGTISQYRITKDRKGNTNVTMNVSGVGISAQLLITLWGGTNEATVTVMPNFNSNRITLTGVILPSEKSDVFQGITF